METRFHWKILLEAFVATVGVPRLPELDDEERIEPRRHPRSG